MMTAALTAIAMAGVNPAATGSASSQLTDQPAMKTIELRQYTLHPGRRDELIELFERHFVESQQAEGMAILGTFRDLDHPDRFVWLRGYFGMAERKKGLESFYSGPVWMAHRDAANATMVDSDNVLLLHVPQHAPVVHPAASPVAGAATPAGLVVARLDYFRGDPQAVVDTFERDVRPALAKAGIPLLAYFLPEPAANNFPRHPIREGERVLVWLTQFDSPAAFEEARAALASAAEPLAPSLERPCEVLRLSPTARSAMRGLAPLDEAAIHDWDFEYGRFAVRHRKLKQRGSGSSEWEEFDSVAETRPLLGGFANVEEHRMSSVERSGVAIRSYDRARHRWSIHWIGGADGMLQAPVYGRFDGDVGLFEGADTDGGRPIVARFVWRKLGPGHARWEQSFSYDAGKSWETNWTMDFTRIVER